LLRNQATLAATFLVFAFLEGILKCENFSKIPNFSENSKCLTTFFEELLRGIGESEVAIDRAPAFIVEATSIQASAGDY
jgi:hypothetical protein